MKWVSQTDKSELIVQIAKELKKNKQVSPPEWASFVKTGAHKERPPVDRDWWYMRTASVLVKVMTAGPIGVSKLRTKYGGKKRRGHKPAEFRKGSGSIQRKILQQLENAGLVKQQQKGVHKGRILTPQGHSLLNSTAKRMVKPSAKKKAKPATDTPKKEKKQTKKHEKEQADKDIKPKPETKKAVKDKGTKEEKTDTDTIPEKATKSAEKAEKTDKDTEAKPEKAAKNAEKADKGTKKKETKAKSGKSKKNGSKS